MGRFLNDTTPQIDRHAMATRTMNRCDSENETRRSIMVLGLGASYQPARDAARHQRVSVRSRGDWHPRVFACVTVPTSHLAPGASLRSSPLTFARHALTVDPSFTTAVTAGTCSRTAGKRCLVT